MNSYPLSNFHHAIAKMTNWWNKGDYSKHATARKKRAIAKRAKKVVDRQHNRL